MWTTMQTTTLANFYFRHPRWIFFIEKFQPTFGPSRICIRIKKKSSLRLDWTKSLNPKNNNISVSISQDNLHQLEKHV